MYFTLCCHHDELGGRWSSSEGDDESLSNRVNVQKVTDNTDTPLIETAKTTSQLLSIIQREADKCGH